MHSFLSALDCGSGRTRILRTCCLDFPVAMDYNPEPVSLNKPLLPKLPFLSGYLTAATERKLGCWGTSSSASLCAPELLHRGLKHHVLSVEAAAPQCSLSLHDNPLRQVVLPAKMVQRVKGLVVKPAEPDSTRRDPWEGKNQLPWVVL